MTTCYHTATIWFCQGYFAASHRFITLPDSPPVHQFTFGSPSEVTKPLNPKHITTFSSKPQLNLSRHNLDEFTVVHAAVPHLRNLSVLDLSHNNLTTLPPELFSLFGLEELDLGYNKLTALPPQIGCLRLLKELLLHSNSLTSLPAQLLHLNKLERLDITNNQIRIIPPLHQSITLWTEGNPLLTQLTQTSHLLSLVSITAQSVGTLLTDNPHMFCPDVVGRHVCTTEYLPPSILSSITKTPLTLFCAHCGNLMFHNGAPVISERRFKHRWVPILEGVCSQKCWAERIAELERIPRDALRIHGRTSFQR